jgi:hypothetical protein
LHTGNIFLSKFSKQPSVKLKNGADFFNGVQVGVEILTSKIRHENGDIFKNGLSKKGVEYFKLSSDTNKSIANFRETIPLSNILAEN